MYIYINLIFYFYCAYIVDGGKYKKSLLSKKIVVYIVFSPHECLSADGKTSRWRVNIIRLAASMLWVECSIDQYNTIPSPELDLPGFDSLVRYR